MDFNGLGLKKHLSVLEVENPNLKPDAKLNYSLEISSREIFFPDGGCSCNGWRVTGGAE